MDVHVSPLCTAAPSPNQPGWHIFPAHCPVPTGLVIEPCLQVPHYSPEMGSSTKWESGCLAPSEVQEEKLGCSKQDQPLSCSRLLLQKRCLTDASCRPTLLQHCLVLFTTCSGQEQVDFPGSTHRHWQGRVAPQLLLQLTAELCPPKAVLPYQ